MNTNPLFLFLVALSLAVPATLSAQVDLPKPPRPQKQQQTTINGYEWVNFGLSIKWGRATLVRPVSE